MGKKCEIGQRRLLTPTTAAIEYGIKRTKFYNWIRNKRFNYIKPDKEVLFWEEDLLKFLDENTVPRDGEKF